MAAGNKHFMNMNLLWEITIASFPGLPTEREKRRAFPLARWGGLGTRLRILCVFLSTSGCWRLRKRCLAMAHVQEC